LCSPTGEIPADWTAKIQTALGQEVIVYQPDVPLKQKIDIQPYIL